MMSTGTSDISDLVIRYYNDDVIELREYFMPLMDTVGDPHGHDVEHAGSAEDDQPDDVPFCVRIIPRVDSVVEYVEQVLASRLKHGLLHSH